MGISVGFGVLEEDSELTIQATLDSFAIVGQDAGLLLKILTLFGRVDVLLESLDG